MTIRSILDYETKKHWEKKGMIFCIFLGVNCLHKLISVMRNLTTILTLTVTN